MMFFILSKNSQAEEIRKAFDFEALKLTRLFDRLRPAAKSTLNYRHTFNANLLKFNAIVTDTERDRQALKALHSLYISLRRASEYGGEISSQQWVAERNLDIDYGTFAKISDAVLVIQACQKKSLS